MAFVTLSIILMGAAFAPTAAAHNPDCVVAAHIGPAHFHYECKDEEKDGHADGCILSVSYLVVRVNIGC